jgi:predicted membrane-bound spermidine synthase
MTIDLRITLWIAIGMLAFAELLGLTGIIPPPHARYVFALSSPHAAVVLGGLGITFCVLYFFSRPAWREALAVLAGSLLILGAYLIARPQEAGRSLDDLLDLYGGALALSAIVAVGLRARSPEPRQRLLAGTFAIAFLLILMYGAFADALLRFTAALHPLTYDAIAMSIDATLGFHPSIAVAAVINNWPWALLAVSLAYGSLPFGCAALYGLQLSRPRRAPVSILLVFSVSGAAALFLYHVCPIAGPRYAFGAQYFVWSPGAVESVSTLVAPAPRNGMPSMHLGWALLLWMNAMFMERWVRALFAVFAALTGLATLALGEHYLVDLVAAVPWVVAVQAACALGLGWGSRARVRALAVGMALTLAWIVAVRYGVRLFEAVPGLTWAAIVATIAASVRTYRPLAQALAQSPSGVLQPVTTEPTGRRARKEVRWVGGMFVISGFAALVYQVLFSKTLALTFGSTATATYTVLATYMGGMALGAWLGGRLAQGRWDALRLYALCEVGIGAYCLATPVIFHGIQALYVALAGGIAPDASVLTPLRVALGVGALMVPTVLMGMTLPILARFFESRAATLGTSVALLYGANTVGAALGALLAGYLIIPVLGVWKTTLTAAGLNFVVVWLALRLRARAQGQLPEAEAAVAASPGLNGTDERRLGHIALVTLAVGGVVTLALEVNYVHLLAVVAGNSVYAFSLMLFAFLLGLGAGAEIARRLLRLGLSLPLTLAWLQFALAAVILAGVYLWEGLPNYFDSFAGYPLHYGFGAREVVRGLVCLVAMFPPALVIGALYPVAMECVGRASPARPIAALGRAAALNTAGNIVGVLAAGFWLLPSLGALRSVQLLAVMCLGLGLFAIAWSKLKWKPLVWAPAALVAILLLAQPRSFDYSALASGANVYFYSQQRGRVIDHAESVDGGLTTVAESIHPQRGRVLTLLTNGKFQGNNDTAGEMPAQVGVALSPLLHTDSRNRALVIGFGTGVSARTLHAAGFAELDVVDLSADIVRLAHEHFGDANDYVIAKPGVNTFITDGRNFLMLRRRTYDVISLEISSIWFAGAASLYNREFYELVKRRLADGGVLQQWVQLHHIQPSDILYILGSVRTEFRYVWLYLIGGQGMIIAANDARAATRPAYLERIDRSPALRPLLDIFRGTASELTQALLLDPNDTDAFLGGFGLPISHWVSTDDNLRLEYSTPKGNALDGGQSMIHNIELIRSVRGGDRKASGNPAEGS